MTCEKREQKFHTDDGSLPRSSDWLKQISQAARPIRSTNQIWVVTSHQYRIFALVSQTFSRGETAGSVATCRLVFMVHLVFTVFPAKNYNRLLAQLLHFTTTTRIFQDFVFCCNYDFWYLNFAGTTELQYKRYNKNDSVHSSNLTPSRKWPLIIAELQVGLCLGFID